MAQTKYGKYIVTDYPADKSKFEGREDFIKPVTFIDGRFVEGAFYAESGWIYRASEGSPPAHTHDDYDEILMFLGSDPANPHELNGEVELWLGDEKHLITKTAMVFVPRGLRHCPMYFRRVDKPILHLAAATMTSYSRDRLGEK
ncbi:MAG TPA: hypothetical protein GX699_12245 [Firmicutes bacterium]|nr:hypothetical protein [Bacillota bacterium]